MACVLDRRRIDGDHFYVSISALQSILTQGIIFSKMTPRRTKCEYDSQCTDMPNDWKYKIV